MAKTKTKTAESSNRRLKPAATPQARENQLIALAMDRAEEQLRDGTASSQVITHFLKLGTERERIEREILEQQSALINAKTDKIKSDQRVEELFENAINAFKQYSGRGGEDETDDY